MIGRKFGIGLLAVASIALGTAMPGSAQTIVDEWSQVATPPPPALKPVVIDPKTTALLVMDFVKQSCNETSRPRCIASIPKIKALMSAMKANGVSLIWTMPSGPKPEDFLPDVAPPAGTKFVVASVDKFHGTDLEQMLKERGLTTVIAVGTAAQGAVLYTASAAAVRGFHVVVPLDGVSASQTYAEEATAWILSNAPTVANNVTLTRSDMITAAGR